MSAQQTMAAQRILCVLLAVLPFPAHSFLTAAPGLMSVKHSSSVSSHANARSAFVGVKTTNLARTSRVSTASPVMALQGGERVAVLGAFERIGVCTLQCLTASPFKPVMQTPPGFSPDMRVKWPIDGLDATLPKNVQYSKEMPVCAGAILASEGPADGPEIEFVLGNIPGLKKVVFLSRAGVEQRESNFLLKFNPFLKLDKWAAAEEAVTKYATDNGIEYTIVRAAALEGGPFYNSNREFASALEGSLFDLEAKAMEISVEDTLNGKTTRDLAALALIQALSRDVSVFSLVSVKSGALTCSVKNHMDLPPVNQKARSVFTPTPEEWDAAFAQV